MITFTNNTAAGKSPLEGAFFYVEGNLKQLVMTENQFASGGADCCIYVRPTTRLSGQDTGIQDIEISHNVFHDFRNPITVGDKLPDPSRQDSPGQRQRLSPGREERNSASNRAEARIESVSDPRQPDFQPADPGERSASPPISCIAHVKSQSAAIPTPRPMAPPSFSAIA